MTFAAITVALISGAVVGRMKFKSWMVFVPAMDYTCICSNIPLGMGWRMVSQTWSS